MICRRKHAERHTETATLPSNRQLRPHTANEEKIAQECTIAQFSYAYRNTCMACKILFRIVLGCIQTENTQLGDISQPKIATKSTFSSTH